MDIKLIMQPEEKEKKSFFKKYWKEILFIGLAFLIFLALFYFLFIYKKSGGPNNSNNTPNQGLLGFNFKDLFDFSNNNNNSNNNSNNSTSSSNSNTNQNYDTSYYFEGLIEVWDKPVAGYGFYQKNGDTILQFVDSETGYVYEKNLNTPTSTPIQITNKSYPNIAKAYFLNTTNDNKSRVFLQYSDGGIIKTLSADLPTTNGGLKNINTLPDNISYIAVSPDFQKLAYVVQKNAPVDGGFEDLTSDWYKINGVDNVYGERFYQSPFGYWKLNILNDGQVYAYTTDSYFEPTDLYKVVTEASTSKTSLSYIYGDHNGMSFLINDQSLITSIATANGQKTYQTNFFGNSFTDSSLSQFSFNTLTNKCTQNDSLGTNLIICSVPKQIVSYDYGLPDAWYQGMTSWDDNLYLVNDQYPSGQLLYDFKNEGGVSGDMDGKDLKITNSQKHLAFLNKNDGSLWTLNLQNILNTSTTGD